MNQSFIDALMHLYSLLYLPLPGKKIIKLREKLEQYITQAGIEFPVDECIKIYNTYNGKYFFEFANDAYKTADNIDEIQRHLILEAGNKSQENLFLQERLLIILSLLEFTNFHLQNDENYIQNIRELSNSLNLPYQKFDEALEFITNDNPVNTENDLVIDESKESEELEGEWIEQRAEERVTLNPSSLREKVKGKIHYHFFKEFNFLVFKYTGNYTLFLNDKRVYNNFFYSFRRKDSIQFEGLVPISFEEIEDSLNHDSKLPKLTFSGEDVSYYYKTTNYSIKSFSFYEESGQLIGIIGNNGSGKSTILKLISNQLKPVKGSVSINGADLYSNRYRLNSIISYIPQEELLFPSLTVYENLFYQARLNLGNFTLSEIRYRVGNILEKFQLENIKDVKAGSYIDHKISNYERICLKIAVELIRNPYIIFLDEPLSALSFSDRRKLLTILKEETYNGKLVILTSQLPTPEIFHTFDKVWFIDQDGYLIYSGEPGKSLTFFRNTGLLPYYYIQSRKEQVSPEDVFKIIETKKILSDGSISNERQVSPGAWYDAHRASTDQSVSRKAENETKPLPILPSRLPGMEDQFFIFFLRNIKIKFNDNRYLLLNLFGIPVVGALIALLIRILTNNNYTLGSNELYPLFLFLSVNYIFFTGLLTGGQELFNEKKLLKRDQFLNLSLFSYQNSKVFFLFMVSLIQTFLFTFFSNFILEVKNMTLTHTIIFFSLAALANMLALVLSVLLKKINTMYILIPFLVMPNLILSGYLIDFNALYSGSEQQNTPLISEIIPSKWAYELLVVDHFTQNEYNSRFFADKRKRYNNWYLQNVVTPVLEEKLKNCERIYHTEPGSDSLKAELRFLYNELLKLGTKEDIAPFENLSLVADNKFNDQLYNEIYGYLTYLNFLAENTIIEMEKQINSKSDELEERLVIPLASFKESHHNKKTEDLVTSQKTASYEYRQQLIKKGSPVYLSPENDHGRSHLYASGKRINSEIVPTKRFNISVLWLMILFLYVFYLSDILSYFLNSFRSQSV